MLTVTYLHLEQDLISKASLCCYFALSDFFPLGSFFLFAVENRASMGHDVTFI